MVDIKVHPFDSTTDEIEGIKVFSQKTYRIVTYLRPKKA